MINNNLKNSRINGRSINGSWITNPVEIKSNIFEFLKNKFEDHVKPRPSFRTNLFNKLTSCEAYSLDLPFSNQEIKDAV